MSQYQQSQYGTERSGTQLGQAATGQAGTGQAGTGQAGTGQAGTGQAGTGQSSASQTGTGQSSASQTGTGQAGTGQTGAGRAGGGQANQQAGRRFETASYLSPEVRDEMIQCLNRTLADATVLQTHARYAHWNVKGMAFYGLHELFEDVAEALDEHVDLVAERVTALGGQAMGTAGAAVASCRLPRMPTGVVEDRQLVQVLAERLAAFDANLYDDIQTATHLEDLDTADLLNEVSREVSTLRWFLEAHLQAPSQGGAYAQATGRQATTVQSGATGQ